MRVKFYLSNLNIVARDRGIQDISKSVNDRDIVVLTPDRNTMNVEMAILKGLKKKSIFNLNVTTFSRLAKKYLVENKLYRNVLTKHASVALLKRIMLGLKSDLKVFGKSIEQEGFAEKIFETICLYKSCRIKPEDLYVVDGSGLLSYKLSDLKTIYTEYEKYFADEYTDSFNQLDLFANTLDKETYANTDFYLMDYEDITPAIARVVCALAKYGGSVTICTTTSTNIDGLNNKHVYCCDVYNTLRSVMEVEGIRYAREIVDNNTEMGVLSKNIFSGKDIKEKNKAFALNIVKANSKEDEVKYVLTRIKRDVLDSKVSYDDVGLVVASIEGYKEKLIEILDNCEIPYFFDESEALSDNVLSVVILSILQMMCKGVDKYTLIKLIDTGIFKLSLRFVQLYKAYVKRIDAVGSYLYSIPSKIKTDDELSSNIHVVKELVDMLDWSDGDVAYYKDKLYSVLQFLDFDNFYEMLYAKYVDTKDILNVKKLTQCRKKLDDMWVELEMVMGNQTMTKAEFYSVFKTFVEDIKLNLPPIAVGSLVVCDFEKSYLEPKKEIYMLGANDGELPKYVSETAILSDNELSRIEKNNKLTPTINMINRRKKNKLLEWVLKANEKLTFSYVSVDDKGEELYPCVVATDLARYMEKVEYSNANDLNIIDNNIESIVDDNITKSLALNNLVGYVKNWNVYGSNSVYSRNVTSIYHALGDSEIDVVKNSYYRNELKPIAKCNKLYFRSLTASPSQFECFARCPYSHFLSYGLRLKPIEVAKVSNNDIGNIIHEYLKNTIYDLNNYKHSDDFVANLRDFVTSNLDKVLASPMYARFVASDVNANTIRALFEEVYRMTQALIEQLCNSDYEPMVLEHNFAYDKIGIELNLKNGKQISVTGKVDRIDENKADKTFVIIDYKTGTSKFDNYTEFVAGNKIQLFVYLILYNKLTGMRPVGAFYLPINNKLEKTRKYRYQGFFVKNDTIIGNIDNTLRQNGVSGTTLRLSRTKDGSLAKSAVSTNLAISSEDMQKALDFLVYSLKDRAEKMVDGCIDVMPLYSSGRPACSFCEYRGVCNFNRKYHNRYRKVDKVESINQIQSNKEDA